MSQRPPLNNDQMGAMSAIASFIIGPDKEFFLTGGPGVGKTFTTTEIVAQIPTILSNYKNAMNKPDTINKQIKLTSTTNKASRVLADETGKEAITIHSFMNVKPSTNYSTGKTILKKKNTWRVHRNIILIVDEASMIDQALYKLIQEGTDPSCKIIYIGDKNQLAPVREKLSPAVLLAEHPDLHYEITTPVRNSGSPALMDLCARLRYDIENDVPKEKLTKWVQVPGEIEHIDGSQLEALISTMYGAGGVISPSDPILKGRILSYTNKTVIGYNQHIRDIRNLPTHPTKDEVLIANSHIELGRAKSLNVEDEVTIISVADAEEVYIDQNNFIMAHELEISTPSTGRSKVYSPVNFADFMSLRKHYAKFKDWPNFYRMEEMFVDLRDRDASTVYKAQGSTYEFVIMIMNDIFTSRDISQLRRMLYVGASRAQKKVYVYDTNIHQNKRGIYQ